MAKTYLEIEQEDGSILKFKKDRIKAHWVKEVFKMEKKQAELSKAGDYAGVLDLQVELVASLFNDPKLTADVIYNGVDSDKINTEITRIIGDIVGRPQDDEPGKS